MAIMMAAWSPIRLLILLVLVLWPASSWAFLTDTSTHVETTLPSLPTAGSTAVDPVFGSTVMRLTDASDCSLECWAFYSNKSSFNMDSTKVAAYVNGTDKFKTWDFNPVTLARSNPRIQSNSPAGGSLQGNQIFWSHTVYNQYYGPEHARLYEITMPDGASTTFTNTVVRDFTAELPGITILQPSMSADNDVFAFHTSTDRVVAYKRSTNTILLNIAEAAIGGGTVLNEVEIDKSGRYLVVCCAPSHVYDLQAVPITNTTITTAAYTHRAMGHGFFVSKGANETSLVKVNLATPNTATAILSSGWSNVGGRADHFSLTGSDDRMMTCSYRTNGEAVAIPYDNECLEVSTTGDQAVRRHVHHHANVFSNDFQSQPKGAVSYDGQFIAWTSNWEGANTSTRLDSYIARILPIAPSAVTVIASYRNALIFSWTSGGDGDGQVLTTAERCAGAGCSNFISVANIGISITSFMTTGLVANTSYSIRLKHTDMAGTVTAYSNRATGVTLATGLPQPRRPRW